MKPTTKKIAEVLRCLTNSKTFDAYYLECQRHEDTLRKIYGKDKLHRHVPEEVGRVNRVWPNKRHIVTFYRCAVCMKDLTEAEVKKLLKEK